VYTPISHLVPLEFPVLLFVGAAALDFLLDRMAGRSKWLQAVVAGVGFVLVMMAVEWPTGSFLVSQLAENRVFGTDYYPYMERASDYHFSHEMFAYETTRTQFWLGMAFAFVAAIVTTRVGLAWGDWMRKVRR
jgi:hypothetical protein